MGRIEVEGQDIGRVRDGLREQYRRLKRRIREHLGYLAEVYMAQVLLDSQDKRLPGRFFHQENDIDVPRFTYVRLRERLGVGPDREIDVLGAAGPEKWVCESKWVKDRRAGKSDVEVLLRKSELIQEEMEPLVARMWFFAHDGFTEEAEALMRKKGMFWSVREDLDGLLQSVGLRQLPDVL